MKDDTQKQSSVVSSQSSDENITQPQAEETLVQSEPETTKPVSEAPADAVSEAPADAVQEVTPVESAEPATEETKPETDKATGEVESAPSVILNEAERSEESPANAGTSDELRDSSQPEAVQNDTKEESSETVAPITHPSDGGKDENPNAKWYVVHTYSGHENKVAVTLKQRVESEHLGDKILDVLVPTQDKIEIKGGKKSTIKEKIFPGYILVKIVLDDASWLAVRTTQGVTSFVGMGNKPTPISDAEVQTIVKFTQSEAPVYKQAFSADDTVKIVDGPFSDFIGKIDNVDEERGKVKVLVSIFGRETPVELDFMQVTKI